MKIVVIEDQAMFREVIVNLCRRSFAIDRLDEASSGAEGVSLCAEHPPDVILLDIDLPDAYGLDLIPKLRASSPGAKIIVLSAHVADFVIHQCLKLGVDGFVDKNNEPAVAVVKAIESVSAKRTYFSNSVGTVRALIRDDPMAFAKILSDREQKLLGHFGRGTSEERIGAELGISPATVLKHQRNIMAKLGLHTAADLRAYALKKGFSPPPRESRPRA